VPATISAPPGWPVDRVSEDPALVVPWRCTDGFADSNARTVVVDDDPSTQVQCQQFTVGSGG
jgi:hypothetical protein